MWYYFIIANESDVIEILWAEYWTLFLHLIFETLSPSAYCREYLCLLYVNSVYSSNITRAIFSDNLCGHSRRHSKVDKTTLKKTFIAVSNEYATKMNSWMMVNDLSAIIVYPENIYLVSCYSILACSNCSNDRLPSASCLAVTMFSLQPLIYNSF